MYGLHFGVMIHLKSLFVKSNGMQRILIYTLNFFLVMGLRTSLPGIPPLTISCPLVVHYDIASQA